MIRWTCGPLKVFHFIGNRLKVLYAFSGLSAGSVENGSQTNSRPGLSTSPRINRLFFAEACYDGYCGRVPRCNVLNMSFKRYVICVLKQSIYIYMFTAYLNTVIQCHPKLRMDDPIFLLASRRHDVVACSAVISTLARGAFLRLQFVHGPRTEDLPQQKTVNQQRFCWQVCSGKDPCRC